MKAIYLVGDRYDAEKWPSKSFRDKGEAEAWAEEATRRYKDLQMRYHESSAELGREWDPKLYFRPLAKPCYYVTEVEFVESTVQ